MYLKMANEIKLASDKTPISVFVFMVFTCFTFHNFFLGKNFRGFFYLGIILYLYYVLSIVPDGDIMKIKSPVMLWSTIIAFTIFIFGPIGDFFRFLNGSLRDGNGRLITSEPHCKKCGFMGELNSSKKEIGERMVKVNVEKVVSKTYGDKGRLMGITKSISQVEKKEKQILTTIECPHCGDKEERHGTYIEK